MDLYRLGEACLHGLIQTVEKLVHVIVYKDVSVSVSQLHQTHKTDNTHKFNTFKQGNVQIV